LGLKWQRSDPEFIEKGISMSKLSTAPEKPTVDHPTILADGSVRVPEHTVTMPGSFSPQARKAFTDYFERGGDPAFTGDIFNIRRIYDEKWAGPILAQWEKLYPVKTERTTIGGVTVDIVIPAKNVPTEKANKVIMNFHGGGFILGNGGIGGRLEAVPVAGLGGYRVITVDYRQAPEAVYPAATDDAVAVYRELLKTYRPENIGVYGVSAGGMLTAQLVARLQKEQLPAPAAIAIMAAGATKRGASDSSYWLLGLTGAQVSPPPALGALPQYFSAKDMDDPYAFPASSPAILEKFPPTLVLSSSRDTQLGDALDTSANLVAAKVPNQLYVRERFGHGYFTQVADVPEATAAWQVTVDFFDRYLGKGAERD
jgi:monoterpene epsilon-lactone hydrolase